MTAETVFNAFLEAFDEDETHSALPHLARALHEVCDEEGEGDTPADEDVTRSIFAEAYGRALFEQRECEVPEGSEHLPVAYLQRLAAHCRYNDDRLARMCRLMQREQLGT